MSYSRYCHQPGEILSEAVSDSDVSGYGSCEPLFEGFSHREASVNLAHADQRIFLLQEAKRHLLAMSSGSASLPLSSGSRRSSSDAVPSTYAEGTVRFS